MPFPNFDYCIICETVRPEVGGKLTLLGFYGLAPNVELAIANPVAPSTITLVAGFPPVPDAHAVYEHMIQIRRPDQGIVMQSPLSRLNVSPVGRGIVVSGFVIPPPYVFGAYSIRILVNNEPKLETSVRLRSATPAELTMLAAGGLAPPPTGRTN